MKQNSSSKRHSKEYARIVSILISELNSNPQDDTQTQYIKLSEVMDRFNVNEKNAKRVLEDLRNTTVADNTDYIPFALNYDTPYLQLSSNSVFRGYPLRLNLQESIALACALEQAGMNKDEIFNLLDGVLVKDTELRDEIKKQMSNMQTPSLYKTLSQCIACCISKKEITFNYQSSGSANKRMRTCDALYVFYRNEYWYLSAWDKNDDIQKTYKIDKIENLQPSKDAAEHKDIVYETDFGYSDSVDVELTFTDELYFNNMNWYGIKNVVRKDNIITAVIPYSGSMWLPKQIAATANTVTANNNEVMEKAKVWKETLLTLYKEELSL